MIRDQVEWWVGRIATVMGIAALVLGFMYVVVYEIDRTHCRDAEREIEAFERCEAHAECTPKREDMLVLIESEARVERTCPKDEE